MIKRARLSLLTCVAFLASSLLVCSDAWAEEPADQNWAIGLSLEQGAMAEMGAKLTLAD
jgi:hypothetical protein